MSVDVDKLIKIRGGLRTSATVVINKIEEEMKKRTPSLEAIEEKLMQLKEKERKLLQMNDPIQADIDDSKIDNEMATTEEYHDKIISCKFKTTKFLQRGGKTSDKQSADEEDRASTCSSTCHSQSQVKLPQLEIPKFHGNPTQWQEFWSQYEIIIHTADMDPKVKFTYLRSYLGGNAARAIAGLQNTALNYNSAVDLLKKQFGSKESIIRAHMENLLTMPKVERSSDFVALRNLYDLCEIQIRSLENLGLETAAYSALLSPILITLIPEDIIIAFHREHTIDSEWEVDDLCAFLLREVTSRERAAAIGKSRKTDKETKKQESDGRSNQSRYDTRSRGPIPASASALNVSGSQKFCLFCDVTDHYTTECSKHTSGERRAIIMHKRRCFNCLREGHRASECRARVRQCKFCKRRHHFTLCDSKEKDSKEKNSKLVETPKEFASVNIMSTLSDGPEVILLQTALANVESPNEAKSRQLRCLLDSGSQLSFIKEEESRRLNLEVVGEEQLLLTHFGSVTPMYAKRKKVRVVLRNIHQPTQTVSIVAYETPQICGSILSVPGSEIVKKMQNKGLVLADNSSRDGKFKDCASIEVLIGSDFYWQVALGDHERLGKSTVAIKTVLGWTIQGPAELSVGAAAVGVNSVAVMRVAAEKLPDEDLASQYIRRFWDLETMGVKPEELQNTTNTEVLDTFNKTIRFNGDRYEITLPFKSNMRDLADNFPVATKRTRNLLSNKLAPNPSLLGDYDAILQDQLKEGIIEEVDVTATPKLLYYLPHRPVVRESSATTKVRIVYDASSHGANLPSLNDVLESGPNLNPELLHVLIRFREHRIAFTSDIEKAFLQISVQPSDRDVLRFFWTTDVTNPRKAPLKTFRITRVPFGATCSPFLLNATLKFHIQKFEAEYEETCKTLTLGLYVDDLLSGAENVEKAYKLSEESKFLISKAGMNLRKWNTNAPELKALWNREDQSSDVLHSLSNQEKLKVLGLIWNSQDDTLSFEVTSLLEFLVEKQETKRWVLKSLARIYDPLGLLSPFTVRAKFLYQRLWEWEDSHKKRKLKWDEPLPEELASPFNNWCAEISSLKKLSIPRFYFSEIQEEGSPITTELHCYVDASERGYAAASYLRYTTVTGETGATLIAAKTRVAPIKKLTIPRLELMGAVLGARLVKSLLCALTKKPATIQMWTDSTIVLAWIKDESSTWRPFVSNRICEIQKLSDPSSWNYCPTKDNPADLPTRGRTAEDLLTNTKWWRGPSYLSGPAKDIPYGVKPNQESFSPEVLEEMKAEARLAVQEVNIAIQSQLESPLDLTKFSSLNKVLRITAQLIRVARRCRKEKPTGPLTAEEIQNAEKTWVQIVQREAFPSEIKKLRNGEVVKAESSIFSLGPKLDEDGLLVLGGRLRTKFLTYKETHPWIFPTNHRFSELLVQQCHARLYHAGVNDVLVELRENYWIIRARQLVKKLVSGCIRCRRFRAKPCAATMAPLPDARTTPAPPFSVIGLDYAGPLYNRKGQKCYILLFTCAVTRGIHLEYAKDMTTKSFLLAFRRFAARRGIPQIIYSDNAKTFKRANADLIEIFTNLRSEKVTNYFADLKIIWRFIVDRAPWVGGFYERLVKSVKSALKQTLGQASLSNVELATILAEIEATVNSRPITFVSQEVGDPIPLSPAHFLTGGRLTVLPSRKFSEKDNRPISRNDIRIRHKHQQALLERLWTRWKQEYLLQLRTAHHRNKVNPTQELKVGDVVLVEENRMPRLCWKVAVVDEVFRGRDNIVRSCLLRLPDGTKFKRPIKLLYNLEISD